MGDERVLGFAAEEFRRHIAFALRGWEWRWLDDSALAAQGPEGALVTIRVEPLPPHALSALLAIPRCQVNFTFEGMDAAARAAFLANFDRAFQRGGG